MCSRQSLSNILVIDYVVGHLTWCVIPCGTLSLTVVHSVLELLGPHSCHHCLDSNSASSETVTGMWRLDKLLFAWITCANWACGKTLSNKGSEPNCKTRVTHLAFGIECKAARRVSRHQIQTSSRLKPNCELWYWVISGSITRKQMTYPDKCMNAQSSLPGSINKCPHFILTLMLAICPELRDSLESLPITGTIEADISGVEMVKNIFELRDKLWSVLA